MDIHGQVAPGFEKVAEAFERNFEEHADIGAATAVYVDGQKVVDIWGGTTSAEPAQGDAYGEDKLQLVFSTTKGATAACANLLAQRGQLDVDAPVAAYWPEFGQAGKQDIPVRWLLCHKAGLPVIDDRLTLDEALAWKPVIEALERQAPVWRPGTAHGYHALTFGWLVGEVIRRIDGRSLGTFFGEEIAEPLGLEFWIGLPAEQEHRVAPLVEDQATASASKDPSLRALIEQFMGPETLLGRALTLNGTFDPDVWNLPEVHAAEIGAASGITNARSLSRFYAGLIGPLEGSPAAPLLTTEQIDAARTCQTEGSDRTLTVAEFAQIESTFGLGFITTSLFGPFGGAGAFGHAGAGGSVGFADPDNKIAFGYVMNQMQNNLTGDPRTRALIKASYEAAGAPIAVI